MEGLLEQGGIKWHAVASDVFGVSGWAMLEKISKGETDMEELLSEARGALRKKKAQLQKESAIEGGLGRTVGAGLSNLAEAAHGASETVVGAG